MPKELPPQYNPEDHEARIYKKWEDSGLSNPERAIKEGYTKPDAQPFTMIMPPPNVTGVLHMGHALMLTIEDILVRYKRMRGYRTLWLPGTDHAAIATQSRVEKDLIKKEGKNRHDLGRSAFLERVEAFAKESHDTIVSQIKVMGASCDWSREAFTLDPIRTKAVRTMFKKMYDDGLIYRGNRIVNWDPKGQTTISDDEIVYTEEHTTFYYFQYGPFVIGTARPETKFGDKYVVVHPDDERYKAFTHGQKLQLEWINGPIEATVIKDESIDRTFGTGAMTITPWHSAVDFEIAERHNLDKEQIIDERGKLLPIAGECAGMKIAEARAKIVEKLRSKGLVVKEEPYTHNVATAERTGGIIEPQIKLQWFVDVRKEIPGRGKTLKDLMRDPVKKGEIKVIPDHFVKTYDHWIEHLQDWCISRQIWYGHQVPVWYKGTEIYTGIEDPEGEGWEQDPDTLDTWFSSALWTFSTLGWPEKTEDLRIYHPTDVLETGYEILFFWIARMILMTEYALGTIPFHTVYLHGTVRDAQGRKMSKSLGNGIDPIAMATKFGADASRMALVVGNTPGTDSRISEDKIKGYKHFANKLWNIARFVLGKEGETATGIPEAKTEADKAILDALKETETQTKEAMERYEFHEASQMLYHFAWHTFADVYLEASKKQDDARTAEILRYVLTRTLILLHPFMPFVTEAIWEHMHPDRLLMTESW